MISVTGVHCLRCDHIVVSRAGHDMRPCKCGDVQVDGGRDYLRVVYRDGAEHRVVRIDLVAEEEEDLVREWKAGTDRFGVFPPQTHALLNVREPTPEEIDSP
jgi:hypothetical protein